MNKICKRCGKGWESRVAEPKRCPFCVSPLWNKDRVRVVGGGAKPMPVLDGREVPGMVHLGSGLYAGVKPAVFTNAVMSLPDDFMESLVAEISDPDPAKAAEALRARNAEVAFAKTEPDVKQQLDRRGRPISTKRQGPTDEELMKMPTSERMKYLPGKKI